VAFFCLLIVSSKIVYIKNAVLKSQNLITHDLANHTHRDSNRVCVLQAWCGRLQNGCVAVKKWQGKKAGCEWWFSASACTAETTAPLWSAIFGNTVAPTTKQTVRVADGKA